MSITETVPVIPYIDAHTHMHVLPWDEWERLGMCGMRAAVLSAGTPYARPVVLTAVPGPDDIQRAWDEAIRLAREAPATHFFHLFVAVGISHATRVRDWESLLDRMADPLRDPLVVAVGEMGLDPFQVFEMSWSLEEQSDVLRGQLEVAKALDKPFILHTPSPKKRALVSKGGTALPADVKRHCLHRSLAVIEAVGFDQERLVVDHCDEETLAFVLAETSAHAGISIGVALRDLTPRAVARMVEAHGPDRILLNSDLVGYTAYDLLALPATFREMRRLGLPDSTIHRVAFENARAFYGLPLPVSKSG